MYKTVEEVAEALSQQPEPTIVYKNYDGKDYIHWDDAVRELNRIFGPFGWSTRAISQSAHPVEGIYLAAIEVSVTVMDGKTPITVTRAGFGRAIAQATKAEREQGYTVSPNLQNHDTAASAAGSDALSKATKLLGDAFGLGFYGQRTQQQTYTPRPAVVGTVTGGGTQTSDGRNLSDKQVSFLHNLGWANIGDLTLARAKSIMENRERAAAPAPVQEAVGALPF